MRHGSGGMCSFASMSCVGIEPDRHGQRRVVLSRLARRREADVPQDVGPQDKAVAVRLDVGKPFVDRVDAVGRCHGHLSVRWPEIDEPNGIEPFGNYLVAFLDADGLGRHFLL